MWAGAAGLFASLLFLIGCGSNDESPADELVRYEIVAGELSFEFGEPQDSVVPVPDALLVVGEDGEATYEFADHPQIEFRLDDAELSDLEAALDEISFEEADQELSGATEQGLPALSVTHDGTTVHLGDKYLEINYGEGPVVADQMSDLLDELESLLGHAPGVEEATDEYLRGLKRG